MSMVCFKSNVYKISLYWGDTCLSQQHSTERFKILRKCQSGNDTKIQEALLITHLNPKLNEQLQGRGAWFLPSQF